MLTDCVCTLVVVGLLDEVSVTTKMRVLLNQRAKLFISLLIATEQHSIAALALATFPKYTKLNYFFKTWI